ncbi:hypothetical protein HYY72_00435 [Candidatus Woesearchaeota archaeon]|nr:hypothetical protein [Candidatus Woesearchaeota archaeon]
MDRKILAFAFLISIIVLAGCNNGGSTSPDNFRKGTKGLSMSFVAGTPPEKFLGEGKLTVAIQLNNDGATTINSGNIYLSGFDKSIITGMKETDGISRLGGRTSFDPVGETEIKQFEGQVRLSGNIDTHKPTFLATACYDYETIASPLVCIDPDPFSVRSREKACTTGDLTLSGGQGAPVAVTRVQLSPTTEKLRFSIDLSNAGGGDVYQRGSQNCNPYSGQELSFQERDLIRVDEVKVSNIDITGSCKPLTDGYIRLIGGKRTIFCELDLGSSGLSRSPAFSTPLTMKFSYGYTSSIRKAIEIVRVPG